MARLYLIRHGETEWNRDRRVQGHTDVPLSAVGHDQAAAVAEVIDGVVPRAAGEGRGPRALVYTSDLKRARETAAPITARLGCVARPRADLRERGMGALEGRTFDDVERELPDAVRAYRSHEDRDAIPGMEPLASFRARVLQAIADIATVADEDRLPAVVVTHGGVLHIVLEEALGRDKRFMIGNTTLYKFDVSPPLAPGEALRIARVL